MTIKIRSTYEMLEVPEDDFVFFSDANDVIFNKGWDDIKPLLEKYYQPGKIAMLRENKWVSLNGLKDKKSSKMMSDLAGKNHWKHYPSGNMFGKWKDMKELFGDALYFSDCMKSGNFDKNIWMKRFFIPENIIDYLSVLEDKSAAYDDETCLFFVQRQGRMCLMEYNELVSWQFMNQDAPLIHYCGNNWRMKNQLGGRFNIFEQPELPIPFARCRYMQIEFPRKKWIDARPCRGDSALCTYADLKRGANTCRPVTQNPKTGELNGCSQYVPIKIEKVKSSMIAEKIPECKK